MSGRVTIDDIAEASRTSPATVSLALRNKPGVSAATRERILAVAQALGYRRPARASADAGAELRNLGAIFRTWQGGPERSSPALNRFYSWVLTGIQEAATAHHLNLVLVTIPVDAENRPGRLPERVLRQPLDAGLIVGTFRPETVEEIAGLTATSRPPLLLVDAEHDAMDCVVTENAAGAIDATTYLIGQGHRRIGYFGPSSVWEPNFHLRREGFVQAMAMAGLEPAGTVEESTSELGASKAARRALAAIPEATAFICANDSAALALLRAAQESGRRVPDDLSIMGFDDVDRALESVPPLTTMAVDKLGLGRLAVEVMTYRMGWPEGAPIRLSLRARLVERGTVRPPA